MPEDRLSQLRKGYAEEDYLALEPPNLGSLRALTESAEFADVVAMVVDAYGRPLRADDPLASLARDIVRALTEAGFTLHHCAQSHPLYRLGGVCLVPVARGHDPDGRGGVVVSWTTHNLLRLDWDRWREYQGAQGVMNGALSGLLDALGFGVWPFGVGDAWIVTGRRVGSKAAER